MQYIDTYKKHVAPKTLDSYPSDASYLVPIEKIPLYDLTAEILQGLINDLAEKGYPPSVQKRVLNLMKSALRRAVHDRLISFSPAEYLKAAVVRQKDLEIFEADELEAILVAAGDRPWAIAIHLNALSGVRLSELLALRWEDVNFRTGELYIHNKVIETRSQGLVIGPTKTPRSKRKISLSDHLLETLIKKKPEGWLFENSVGHVVTPSRFYKWYRSLFKGLDIPYRPPETLRHTHATILISSFVFSQILYTHYFVYTHLLSLYKII